MHNKYYLPCKYINIHFNKNDIIEYKIILVVNNHDYHIDIHVPMSYKVKKQQNITFFSTINFWGDIRPADGMF